MKNKLIVDSGSTKTDWVFITPKEDYRFTTQGINPSASDKLFDLAEETEELIALSPSIAEINYFGAGVIDARTRNTIKSWLNQYFTQVEKYTIESDMLAAAKATAGDKEGIICILGTGSNSCLYDGSDIIDNIPALGFALSNEGGGSKIGSELLKAFFYRKMPPEVKEEFSSRYQVTKSRIVKELYSHDNPTAYLASFAKFLNETVHKNWRKDFLTPLFQEFIDIRIKQYSEYLQSDIYFVGSIAYFYADVIRDVLQYNGLTCKSIIEKPIDGLVDYFK